jgi:hypothetical protein
MTATSQALAEELVALAKDAILTLFAACKTAEPPVAILLHPANAASQGVAEKLRERGVRVNALRPKTLTAAAVSAALAIELVENPAAAEKIRNVKPPWESAAVVWTPDGKMVVVITRPAKPVASA